MNTLYNLQHKLDRLIKSDVNEDKNIGTFTAIHKNPFVYQYLYHYLNKNIVDRKAYTSLNYFEKSIDDYFKKLFKVQKGSSVLTSGSTESVLLAFHYAKEQALADRNITKPNILIPTHAHYSLKRCAKMIGLEVRDVPTNKHFTSDINVVRKLVDKNTILITGIMISTELGVIDDIASLNEIAREHNTYIHIDGAIGGFIIPYLDTAVPHTFEQLDRLFSMNISCHKFGLSLCGSGILLLHDRSLIERFTGSIEYLSSGAKKMANLTVTGSALGVFSMYTNLAMYKFQGYQQFAKKYVETKQQLADILESYGYTCFGGSAYSPQLFVYGNDIERLSEYMDEKGWIQHVYKVKGLGQKGMRIVIKKDQEAILLKDFVNDVKDYHLLTNRKLILLQNKYPHFAADQRMFMTQLRNQKAPL